ncbi:Transcription factor TFIIIB component B'' [Babesia microti strain RI]|uniref:Transcription factor TFIIIB component B n=1 Tax=Babesia microti (strain RI) TaxID=1133968 RepID=I7J8E7_BABMR|nr:Transcription factor TFIIIB component B'' [Babesia microti strain RI]CCF72819.1 Transcription factor TFIIIB component B'' [Babesia microti strain RI]|eukprot:XP_012647428.1 Transcription factor TFIIIB component B'' [Babesia microti strain RI]
MVDSEDTIWNIVHSLPSTHKNKRNLELAYTNVSNQLPALSLSEIHSPEMQLLLQEPCRISENISSSQIQPYEFAYKKNKCTKWSDRDTDTFYRAIEMFGSDLLMVNGMLPHYTAKQIHIKFKNEEKKSPDRLQAALNRKGEINIDFYESLSGKISHHEFKNPQRSDNAATKVTELAKVPILDAIEPVVEPVNILELLL